jgi:hypothetical protein
MSAGDDNGPEMLYDMPRVIRAARLGVSTHAFGSLVGPGGIADARLGSALLVPPLAGRITATAAVRITMPRCLRLVP